MSNGSRNYRKRHRPGRCITCGRAIASYHRIDGEDGQAYIIAVCAKRHLAKKPLPPPPSPAAPVQL